MRWVLLVVVALGTGLAAADEASTAAFAADAGHLAPAELAARFAAAPPDWLEPAAQERLAAAWPAARQVGRTVPRGAAAGAADAWHWWWAELDRADAALPQAIAVYVRWRPATEGRAEQQTRWLRAATLRWGAGVPGRAGRAAATALADAVALQQWLLGRPPNPGLDGRPRPVPVTLLADSLVGDATVAAEERAGELFVYRAGVERTPARWFRELSHELGHLSGPKIGRYGRGARYEPWLEGHLYEQALAAPWLRYCQDEPDEAAAQAAAAERAAAAAAWAALPLAQIATRAADEGDAGVAWALGFGAWLDGRGELAAWFGEFLPRAVVRGAELERSYRVRLGNNPRALDGTPLVGPRHYLPRGAWALEGVGSLAVTVTSAAGAVTVEGAGRVAVTDEAWAGGWVDVAVAEGAGDMVWRRGGPVAES